MQPQMTGILSLMTFLPLLGALIVMFLPRPMDLPEAHHGPEEHEPQGESTASNEPVPLDLGRMLVNGVSLLFSGLSFLISIALFAGFRGHYSNPRYGGLIGNMQFVENVNWIHISAGRYVHYHMGVDGVSLLLVLLTTFLSLLCILFSVNNRQRLKEFMVFLLILESAMIGLFCALDLVLFYVFFEAILIPMYFLIGIFGHENRVYAAIKFFIYTFAGSILMLVAIVAVYTISGSFDIVALSNPGTAAFHALHGANPQALVWLFAAFSLAFMIKVPMFPFHTWLPDAHVEAPTAGSVLLAGILLKIGTYGFLRICLPIFREQAITYAPLFIVLAIVGIIYGSLVAAVQPDAKKLVAYSSVAHLGFVILGIFTFTRVGIMGALVQNINHGISTPMLFFLVGMLYDRRHTRLIDEFGGLKRVVPMLSTMMLIATLASIAVPFFNGFVGEFPILLGTWIASPTNDLGSNFNWPYWPTALAATGMILSAVYMLWWFQRLMLGPITHPINRRMPDLSRVEWAVLTPLAAMIFWIGLGSTFWTQRMDTSVNLLLPTMMVKDAQEQLGDHPVSTMLQNESAFQEYGIRALEVQHGVRPPRRFVPPVMPGPGFRRERTPAGAGTGRPAPGAGAAMPQMTPNRGGPATLSPQERGGRGPNPPSGAPSGQAQPSGQAPTLNRPANTSPGGAPGAARPGASPRRPGQDAPIPPGHPSVNRSVLSGTEAHA